MWICRKGSILTGDFPDAAPHITSSRNGMRLFPGAFLWSLFVHLPQKQKDCRCENQDRIAQHPPKMGENA